MNRRLNVLDKGYVELVDYMGSDQAIVNSARVSVEGEQVKATSSNRQLIRYLLRKRHTTPFESVVFTFAVKAPILTVRQWHRHRTASYNEMSARYGVLPNDFYIPELSRINPQAKKNHQGSQEHETMQNASLIQQKLKKFNKLAYEVYSDLNTLGLARELSRNVLPVSIYTRMYCTMNLHNLFHFLRLRMDSHAQKEIRVFAEAMFELIKEVCPEACQAFEDYQMGGMYLNRMEVDVIQSIFDELGMKDEEFFEASPSDEDLAKIFGSKREVGEFQAKASKLLGYD